MKLAAIYEGVVEQAASKFDEQLRTRAEEDAGQSMSSQQVAAQLASADPTRAKVFVAWLCRQYIMKQFSQRDLEEVRYNLQAYYAIKDHIKTPLQSMSYHDLVGSLERFQAGKSTGTPNQNGLRIR